MNSSSYLYREGGICLSWPSHMVGADGFEPSTSTSRTLRASRAALRPDNPTKHVFYKQSIRPVRKPTTSTLAFLNNLWKQVLHQIHPLTNEFGAASRTLRASRAALLPEKVLYLWSAANTSIKVSRTQSKSYLGANNINLTLKIEYVILEQLCCSRTILANTYVRFAP